MHSHRRRSYATSTGIARQVFHANRYVVTDAPTPELAVRDYLSRYGDLLGLQPRQLERLSLAPELTPTSDEVEFRILSEKHQFDLVTVSFYQTYFGLPVWEAGLSITMKAQPFRVVSAQTTRHADLVVKRPSALALATAKALDNETLAKSLGITGSASQNARFRIDRRRLMIYRYEEAARTNASVKELDGERGLALGAPSLPLPPIDPTVREGQHYVVSAVDFRFDVPPFQPLHWVALVDIETLSVLLLRPFVASVTGKVFKADPITTAGSPPPSATSAALNPARSSVTLAGLDPPANGRQTLTGSNVALSDIESPTVSSPTELIGIDFDFDARTNDFAAVSAYYHCDRFYRLVEHLGFSRSSYFASTTFPSPVDHRGHKNSPDGIEINAHCVGNSGGAGIGYTSFMLADLGDTANPIGIACDPRIALHELCGHGTLFNHVNNHYFGFAHSAGDSFAAILNDPGSHAPDRFVTFPWIAIANRHHNRSVACGWGWSGNIALHPFDPMLDNEGYNNEQILSTTMFRIYCSIGGDSDSIDMKRFAARVTCHLMLAAIGTFTPATNPPHAADFACALRTVDGADWPSEGLSGGAYNKVIRWAFEKQGMYQPTGAVLPNNNEGVPPPVDIYIEDGRSGEYPFQSNHWSCQAIWNRHHSDGGAGHQEPVVGVINYAYVKIKNRGAETATNVVVRAFHCRPSAGLVYPDDWKPMTTPQLAAPDVPPNSGSEIWVGPFEWVPSYVGHECMLMVASAAGDPSNVDNFTTSDSIPDWRLVPNDNNIGQRNVSPVSSASMKRLVAEFDRMSFQLKNSFNKRARMTVSATLPTFLKERGWGIAFVNAGTNAFSLEAGAERNVVMKLNPGREYKANDIGKADEAINIEAYADGILVGGISYPLDKHAKKVAVPRTPRRAPTRRKASKKKRRPASRR